MCGNIEGGVTYPFLSKTKFPLFSELSFRMSRALKENYSNVLGSKTAVGSRFAASHQHVNLLFSELIIV